MSRGLIKIRTNYMTDFLSRNRDCEYYIPVGGFILQELLPYFEDVWKSVTDKPFSSMKIPQGFVVPSIGEDTVPFEGFLCTVFLIPPQKKYDKDEWISVCYGQGRYFPNKEDWGMVYALPGEKYTLTNPNVICFDMEINDGKI